MGCVTSRGVANGARVADSVAAANVGVGAAACGAEQAVSASKSPLFIQKRKKVFFIASALL